MATRGMIGVELPDGRVRAIYNHYDSYPSHLGTILEESYYDKDAAESLCTYHTSFIDKDGTPDYSSDDSFDMYASVHEYYTVGSEKWGVEYMYLLTDEGWDMYDVTKELVEPLEDVLDDLEAVDI